MKEIYRPNRQILIRYFKGGCTPDEAAIIELYLAMDIDAAFVRKCLLAAQEDLQPAEYLSASQEQLDKAWEIFEAGKITANRLVNKRKLIRNWCIAAAAILSVLLSIPFFNKRITNTHTKQYAAAISYQRIQAPKGRISKVTLPDGSKVTLFPGSGLKYPDNYNLQSRPIVLEGKAYFDVMPIPDKPFSVESRGLITTVLGTSFEIDLPNNNAPQKVTLRTGKVSLKYKGEMLGYLSPDEQMVVSAGGEFTIRKVNTERHVAWLNEQLIYEQVPLSEICNELESWYDVKIVISQQALKERKMTARFKKQPLNIVLDILARTGKFQYKTGDRQVIIY